jgi:hypothetical protein
MVFAQKFDSKLQLRGLQRIGKQRLYSHKIESKFDGDRDKRFHGIICQFSKKVNFFIFF